MPNAASSAVSASTNGTTAAATAPKAMSRITKVAGMVMTNECSRSPFTTSLMSSLMSVRLTACISIEGWLLRGPSTAALSSAIGSRVAPAWYRIRAGTRALVPSAETNPNCGGTVNGSTIESALNSGWSSKVVARRLADDVGHSCLEFGVGGGAWAARQHDEEILAGFVLDVGIGPDLVAARRLCPRERRRVGRTLRGHATGHLTEYECADGRHEPRHEDEPAVAGAPRGYAHRRGPARAFSH
jgi:hypothetical protein